MLFQKDMKIKDKWRKAEVEKVKLEKKLWAEIECLEDAGYAMFEEGSNKAVTKWSILMQMC